MQEEDEKEEGWEAISDGKRCPGNVPEDKGRQAVRRASIARHALPNGGSSKESAPMSCKLQGRQDRPRDKNPSPRLKTETKQDQEPKDLRTTAGIHPSS